MVDWENVRMFDEIVNERQKNKGQWHNDCGI